MHHSLVVLICCLHPPKNLFKLVEELRSLGFSNFIFVDDGSGESFKNIFEELERQGGTKIITLAKNQGKGIALKRGLEYFLEQTKFESVLCMDCDWQHTPKSAHAVALGKSSKSNVVLGVRTFWGKIPFRNKFGNLLTRVAISQLGGHKISDSQTGLRLLDRKAATVSLECSGSGFEFETIQLLEFMHRNLIINEVPIETIYIPNSVSHFRPITDSFRIYRALLKQVFRRVSKKQEDPLKEVA